VEHGEESFVAVESEESGVTDSLNNVGVAQKAGGVVTLSEGDTAESALLDGGRGGGPTVAAIAPNHVTNVSRQEQSQDEKQN